ncbi:MAG: hypothetical protein H6843_14465 [Rhodospirillaceae bacterium]|nr:hypothetical protein [Rhodospirillaceae bacterium]
MDRWIGYFSLDMGLHGWLALAIAVVGIIALNVGLMRLARKPWKTYDDEAQDRGDGDARGSGD